MDQLEQDILSDAYDDYEELYFILWKVKKYSQTNDICSTINLLNEKLQKLSEISNITIHRSNQLYGEMTHLQFRPFKFHEIETENGEIAGPPYYYVHLGRNTD